MTQTQYVNSCTHLNVLPQMLQPMRLTLSQYAYIAWLNSSMPCEHTLAHSQCSIITNTSKLTHILIFTVVPVRVYGLVELLNALCAHAYEHSQYAINTDMSTHILKYINVKECVHGLVGCYRKTLCKHTVHVCTHVC